MVQVQARIVTNDGKDLHVEFDILDREDSNEFERMLAESLEAGFKVVLKAISETDSFNCTEIKRP